MNKAGGANYRKRKFSTLEVSSRSPVSIGGTTPLSYGSAALLVALISRRSILKLLAREITRLLGLDGRDPVKVRQDSGYSSGLGKVTSLSKRITKKLK